MRKVLCLVILWATLAAQLPVQPPKPRVFVVMPDGRTAFVELDASLGLDTSGPVPLLKVVAPLARAVRFIQWGSSLRADMPTVAISDDPAPMSLRVYRNGLLLLDGLDYTYTGRVITFIGAVPGAGDTLQVSYRVEG